MKIVLNPDKELVKKINSTLEENLKKYGNKYCPCKDFLDSTKLGECLCGKYIKTEI